MHDICVTLCLVFKDSYFSSKFAFSLSPFNVLCARCYGWICFSWIPNISFLGSGPGWSLCSWRTSQCSAFHPYLKPFSWRFFHPTKSSHCLFPDGLPPSLFAILGWCYPLLCLISPQLQSLASKLLHLWPPSTRVYFIPTLWSMGPVPSGATSYSTQGFTVWSLIHAFHSSFVFMVFNFQMCSVLFLSIYIFNEHWQMVKLSSG